MKKKAAMQDFNKYYILGAEPTDIYNVLTNKEMLEIWTGEEAIMEPIPGTEFSLWGGSISGKNLEFEPNKKVVQQWYFEGQEEPSIVTFKLFPHKKGTSVHLIHTNIPDEAYDNISSGWDFDFFASLNELFV